TTENSLDPSSLEPHFWRTDVLLMSPWLAPIMWEGTFNRDILNAQYRQKNFVVGVATFAVKKYVRFIEGFLGSANKFFLSGHRVNFYLFTDHPEKVPSMKLAPEKSLVIIPVQNYSRWQDISMNRMDIISNHIRTHWRYEVDYLYSMDIDVQMFEHIGVEIIDTLVGTISSWQYTKPRDSNSYERRPESRAAIPSGEGDFYYAASFYGGSVSEVYKLTTACFKGVTEDRANGIEAKWHEESHLNKYLLYHKPTRLLSPEYYWDEELIRPLRGKVPEEPEEGLQPGALKVRVRQGLPHATEGTSFRDSGKPRQVHARAHSSMQELPADIPCGPQD
uniref:Histo-blood group ABO system transferase 1-like n=1 Tax=Terrapene triunguis TaxID=2587831 RepID=A0A674IL53_9SAUR